MKLKSIWDGWEKQCFFKLRDEKTGAVCAGGWLWEHNPYTEAWKEPLARVAAYIREHYNVPSLVDLSSDWSVMVYANNRLKLTPEDFRRIDRETQVTKVVEPFIESVESVEPEVEYAVRA